MKIDMSNLISVSEVSKNTSATIAKAAAGVTQIVLNHNKPVAAIVDIKLLEMIDDFLHEQEVMRIAEERIREPRGQGVTLDELLEKHRIKRPAVRRLPPAN
jgi:hypothetical protein